MYNNGEIVLFQGELIAATCAKLINNNKMEQIRFSELDPTMVAKRTFDNLLELIQSSNLNFHLKISPFSALIYLKKSLIF